MQKNGETDSAKRDLNALFDGHAFDTPKSVGLVQRMIDIGCEKTGIVLDFAGSGTTAENSSKGAPGPLVWIHQIRYTS